MTITNGRDAVPFTDMTRKAAFQLLLSGELKIHEVADLAGVSRQGLYKSLDLNEIDLDGCRFDYIRERWRRQIRKLKYRARRVRKRGRKKKTR
jgi:aryl carrier-like protein